MECWSINAIHIITISNTQTSSIRRQRSNIRVFTSNVRGVIKNWDAIKQIKQSKYDILLFNEIWQVRDFEHIQIPEFTLANIKQRENTRGGGSLIFIRSNLIHEKFESPYIEGVIETSSIIVNNTVIVSLYRPPSGNKNQFVQELTSWIETIGNKNIFIAGDFNINYLSEEVSYFNAIETECMLKPSITGITRVASATCIDNVLTNVDGKHVISQICIADHQGICSILKCHKTQRDKQRYTYREMKDQNWHRFSEGVANISIRGNTINEKWSNLSVDIKKIVETSFPEKQSNIRYTFQMSRGLLKSKNKKNKLLKQYKRGQIPKENYIRYNKIYRKLILAEQEKSFQKRLEESGTDSKRKWRVLKDELKLSHDKDSIDKINVDGIVITDKERIAKSFKKHFETCATKLANNVTNSGECEILINQKQEWGFKTVQEKEIIETIDSLLPKSSCGFDLLSNKMLKREKTKFSKLLLPLINETIIGKEFPEVLKTAKVIPIFKKGDKTNLNNYRPISLLPVLSKVVEKIINKQLTERLDRDKIIDDNQYGFRKGHSTEDAVIKFIDYIEKAKNTKKHVISIHIDVSKAFDSCNHDILKAKLKRIGLNENSLDLMSSYLKDRAQELWIEKICGGKFVINIGVGQGTVLGPTLFKIYI